jgi:hypothetical protein
MARVPEPWYRASRDAWYVELNGRQHRLAKGKNAKGAATRAFARLLAEEGRAPAQGDPTVIEACELYLDHAQGVQRPGTYEQHRMKLTAFARRFGKVKVRGLSVSAVQRWLAGLEVADTTRRNYVTSIKAALNWCVSEGICGPHPLAKLPKPKGARRERVLSPGEKAKLIEAVRGTAVEGFLAGLLLSGCRPHELAALAAADVDFEAGTARGRGEGPDAYGVRPGGPAGRPPRPGLSPPLRPPVPQLRWPSLGPQRDPVRVQAAEGEDRVGGGERLYDPAHLGDRRPGGRGGAGLSVGPSRARAGRPGP